MAIIGNILWLVFGGLLMGLLCYLIGAILCLTIIGIPFGLQIFKIGTLFLWPFGSDIDIHFEAFPLANILWLIFFGIELSVSCLIMGALFCITIIGIPFGLQWFKLAQLTLLPFGAIVK
ncbi:MAG: YccF domain-containing protein [Bacilli bacterium]